MVIKTPALDQVAPQSLEGDVSINGVMLHFGLQTTRVAAGTRHRRI
jgi:hypothetical protein